MRGHARQKAAEKVRDVAAELLDIYAQRAAKRASRLNTIVSSISCSATASRLKPRRIRRRPLMRYLATCVSRWQWIVWCAAMLALVNRSGDARRFPAVDNHKQVAVLVPTTLLAQQHYDNFRYCFANWPVRIEIYSRFRSARADANPCGSGGRENRYSDRYAQTAAK